MISDEVYSRGVPSLKIDQCDTMFRTQKRTSMRVKFNKPAYLYLTAGAGDNDLERSPGLNCVMDDISDKGCAYKVKGKVPDGMRLKVQFALNKIPVCMPGTVRSVEFDGESNVSLVHMQADALDTDVRNRILCEVFQMLPDEDDDELPYRVLEQEADSVMGGSSDADSMFDVEDV
jgi:hypothetical protein